MGWAAFSPNSWHMMMVVVCSSGLRCCAFLLVLRFAFVVRLQYSCTGSWLASVAVVSSTAATWN